MVIKKSKFHQEFALISLKFNLSKKIDRVHCILLSNLSACPLVRRLKVKGYMQYFRSLVILIYK